MVPIPLSKENPMSDDPRPRFSICHVQLTATDTNLLGDFYATIGMRLVAKMASMSILELRGGTHLVIFRGEPGSTKLDLMVDDLDDIHALLTEMDANPGPIIPGSPHNTFTVADPEGNQLLIESSHVTGPV